jgi:adenylate kinase family enzyme
VEHLASARRVLVIGCSGGGKSTLAQALSAQLNLPYISMDRAFFWLPGWKLRERSEIRSLIAEAVREDRWIMDGTGHSTLDLRLPRADTVIWVRLPRLLCAARVILRWMRYFGRSRPEMADGCPEKIDLEFLRYIWNFERKHAPKILEGLARHSPDVLVFILDSRGDADTLLALLERRDTH